MRKGRETQEDLLETTNNDLVDLNLTKDIVFYELNDDKKFILPIPNSCESRDITDCSKILIMETEDDYLIRLVIV